MIEHYFWFNLTRIMAAPMHQIIPAVIPAFACPGGTKMHILNLGTLTVDEGWYVGLVIESSMGSRNLTYLVSNIGFWMAPTEAQRAIQILSTNEEIWCWLLDWYIILRWGLFFSNVGARKTLTRLVLPRWLRRSRSSFRTSTDWRKTHSNGVVRPLIYSPVHVTPRVIIYLRQLKLLVTI